VRRIIEERGIYGARKSEPRGTGVGEGASSLAGGGGTDGASMRNIEDAARGMINPYRFIHSRNVALHSTDLAGRFGLDEDSAYLAGIAHDICKELPPDEMMEYALKDGGTLSDWNGISPVSSTAGRRLS
jgi:hypothetical protein